MNFWSRSHKPNQHFIMPSVIYMKIWLKFIDWILRYIHPNTNNRIHGHLFHIIRYLKGFYHIWVWWPWPLKLIYSRCLIMFNISSENNDFGFNSIQKINFSKNVPIKCIRKQIWPWRLVGQGQLRTIIWTNLVGPTSPMLHTKSQYHRPSGSGEEYF